ncbi:hypothetical protein D7U98_10440 [Stenotrophomonas maltophilia]|nr:hypothetical protein [Stenotrophomonas maltophilia]MBH1495115.1 hypothetical protein [Stenotrophomonas maltophilia]MBN4961701.1 hypothetical protein [Stenotrophomonas maltophilia]QGL78328.1 hypothetical protein FEO95_00095 [Stenotrophomonas maltophilia]
MRHLHLCAVIAALIGGTYLSIFGSIGGGDWTGKPTEAELRAATETFELSSGVHPTNVKFLPKVTFLGAVFDAELESDPEKIAAFFIKQAAEKRWRLQQDKRQRHYRLMVFCEERLARSVELTTRGSTVKLYGGSCWDSDRDGDYYCSTDAR